MRYKEALDYLYNLQKFGIKLGLDNTKRLLSALGNPHLSFKSVHVAGTNGKGSTTAAIESILRAHGFRTGLFTSPHLFNFTERIRINGKEISQEQVIELAGRLKELANNKTVFPGDFSPTFFEIVTGMAFLYFKEEAIEWAAVETGMGGRLDSTNILLPEASVITTVGLDHKEFLGTTLPEIASEKAGIIKEDRPLILGPQKGDALNLLEKTAREKSSPVHLYGRDFNSTLKKEIPEGVIFDYISPTLNIKDIYFPLAGAYQAINASLAIRTAEVLGMIDVEKIRNGLRQVSLPGRLELVSRAPDIRLDGAHNPEAARALAAAVKRIFLRGGRRLILVTGIMSDKDMKGILNELLPLAHETVFTAPAYGRSAHPEKLMQEAELLGFRKGHISSSVSQALEKATSLCRNGDMVLVTGSFYTAGEAKEALAGKGIFTGLREC